MFKKFYQENKVMVISAGVAIVAILGVLFFVKSEVDRFIFTMPIFAGWILFNILMLPDEEELAQDEDKAKKKKDKTKTKA